jgi:hypothetical protein
MAFLANSGLIPLPQRSGAAAPWCPVCIVNPWPAGRTIGNPDAKQTSHLIFPHTRDQAGTLPCKAPFAPAPPLCYTVSILKDTRTP